MVHTRVDTFSGAHARAVIHVAEPTDDKYSRGVVALRTGSTTYPGAAVLGVEGAWRVGAGLVRYLGAARDLVLARRPETVTADGHCDAWVVGSGQTRDDAEDAGITELLAGNVPVVADAGALELVATPHALTVMTPHAGEFARLAAHHAIALSGDDADDAVAVASALGVVVVLKGARTLVATANANAVWSLVGETPWLSTAGTGDVLAGMIGTVIARARPTTHEALARCAAAGVYLHSRAGARAAGLGSGRSHPIVAMDVAACAPDAVADIVNGDV